MDIASLYVRVWFRAKPLASPELDALAERMGILAWLSPNPGRRYFLSKWNAAGASILGRVVFGERYWSMLTEDERLAVCAHEFIHIRHRDSRWRLTHIGLPSIGAAVIAASIASYALGQFVLPSVILAVFAWFLAAYAFTTLNLSNSRRMELRCDTEAAKAVSPSSLVTSLRIADSLISQKVKNGRSDRRPSRSYPTLEERVNAILAVRKSDAANSQ